MKPLTDSQRAVLEYIRECTNVAPPSYREIAAEVPEVSSTSMARLRVQELERLGYVWTIPGVARGMRLVEDDCNLPDDTLAHLIADNDRLRGEVARLNSMLRSVEKITIRRKK